MPNYIRVERSDVFGHYTVDQDQLGNVLDGEFDDLQWMELGTQITLTVVKMDKEEFESLPEFLGW